MRLTFDRRLFRPMLFDCFSDFAKVILNSLANHFLDVRFGANALLVHGDPKCFVQVAVKIDFDSPPGIAGVSLPDDAVHALQINFTVTTHERDAAHVEDLEVIFQTLRGSELQSAIGRKNSRTVAVHVSGLSSATGSGISHFCTSRLVFSRLKSSGTLVCRAVFI